MIFTWCSVNLLLVFFLFQGPRGAFPVSDPPRYPADQPQQGPLPPRVDPKLSHHSPGGIPPAPFPSSGSATHSNTTAQVLTAPAPAVAGAPSVASPTLVTTPPVVSVQQPPPAVDNIIAMKVASLPEQPAVVQQVPNTNTSNAPVNRKLQQTSRGKFTGFVRRGRSVAYIILNSSCRRRI